MHDYLRRLLLSVDIIIHYRSPRLARSHYCQQLTLSVCPFVPLSVPLSGTPLQIASFLFLDGIEPFFGRQFSKCPSSIFDLGP